MYIYGYLYAHVAVSTFLAAPIILGCLFIYM